MRKNYLIIHGSFGTPYSNWFPWLHDYLHALGQQVIVPYFPYGKKHQNFENWSSLLDDYRKMGVINSDTVVIAHSIGCVFIVKYLLEKGMIMDKLILVAPFNHYSVDGGIYDQVNQSFFTDKLDQIELFVGEIICLYSGTDPYVKLDAIKDFIKHTKAQEIFIQNGGHLNSESGYTELKEIVEVL